MIARAKRSVLWPRSWAATCRTGVRLARELIEAVRPALAELGAWAQAYIVLAWGHLWSKGVKNTETLEPLAFAAAKRLVECYHRSSRHDWQWFETRLTYANAVLPHALFVAATLAG